MPPRKRKVVNGGENESKRGLRQNTDGELVKTDKGYVSIKDALETTIGKVSLWKNRGLGLKIGREEWEWLERRRASGESLDMKKHTAFNVSDQLISSWFRERKEENKEDAEAELVPAEIIQHKVMKVAIFWNGDLPEAHLPMIADWCSITVDELKDMLEALKLPTNGNPPDELAQNTERIEEMVPENFDNQTFDNQIFEVQNLPSEKHLQTQPSDAQPGPSEPSSPQKQPQQHHCGDDEREKDSANNDTDAPQSVASVDDARETGPLIGNASEEHDGSAPNAAVHNDVALEDKVDASGSVASADSAEDAQPPCHAPTTDSQDFALPVDGQEDNSEVANAHVTIASTTNAPASLDAVQSTTPVIAHALENFDGCVQDDLTDSAEEVTDAQEDFASDARQTTPLNATDDAAEVDTSGDTVREATDDVAQENENVDVDVPADNVRVLPFTHTHEPHASSPNDSSKTSDVMAAAGASEERLLDMDTPACPMDVPKVRQVFEAPPTNVVTDEMDAATTKEPVEEVLADSATEGPVQKTMVDCSMGSRKIKRSAAIIDQENICDSGTPAKRKKMDDSAIDVTNSETSVEQMEMTDSTADSDRLQPVDSEANCELMESETRSDRAADEEEEALVPKKKKGGKRRRKAAKKKAPKKVSPPPPPPFAASQQLDSDGEAPLKPIPLKRDSRYDKPQPGPCQFIKLDRPFPDGFVPWYMDPNFVPLFLRNESGGSILDDLKEK